MRTLVRKELWEHGWLISAVVVTAMIGFGVTLTAVMIRESGSVFESVRIFALTLFVIVAATLGHRLVVQEYSGRTQLFLESLPLSRLSMLATKYALGLAVATVMLAAAFGSAWLAAPAGESIGGRAVVIMASRLGVYAFFVHAFFFMMGLLGRYRVAIYLALVIVAAVINQTTDVRLGDHGPLGLMDDRFAFERNEFPIADLCWTAAAGAAATVVAAAMGLVREGGVAGMLAERMSYREKVFIAVMLLSSIILATVWDDRRTPDPYRLADAERRRSDRVGVAVQRVADDVAAAASLADRLGDDLTAACEFLGYASAPELSVVHRRDLDPDRVEVARLSNAAGVLVRSHFASPDCYYERFAPIALDAWLTDATDGIGTYEPRCWVLEGFSEYWPDRRHGGDDLDPDRVVDRRAVFAIARPWQTRGVTPGDIDDWYTLRERLGQPVVRSLACSGLVYARGRYGGDKLRSFLREVLGDRQGDNVIGDWKRFRRPIGTIWSGTMGDSYDDFRRDWLAWLEASADGFVPRFDGIPVVRSEGRFEAKSDRTYQLVVENRMLSPPNADDSPPAITVRYQTIDVFDDWEDDDKARDEIQPLDPDGPMRVERLFERGRRLRWTTAVSAAPLGGDVITGWRRVTVGPKDESSGGGESDNQ